VLLIRYESDARGEATSMFDERRTMANGIPARAFKLDDAEFRKACKLPGTAHGSAEHF